jgi:hypothetical protein
MAFSCGIEPARRCLEINPDICFRSMIKALDALTAINADLLRRAYGPFPELLRATLPAPFEAHEVLIETETTISWGRARHKSLFACTCGARTPVLRLCEDAFRCHDCCAARGYARRSIIIRGEVYPVPPARDIRPGTERAIERLLASHDKRKTRRAAAASLKLLLARQAFRRARTLEKSLSSSLESRPSP